MSYYVKNSACYHVRTPIDKVLAIIHGLIQVKRYRPNRLFSISIEVSSTPCLASTAIIIVSLSALHFPACHLLDFLPHPSPHSRPHPSPHSRPTLCTINGSAFYHLKVAARLSYLSREAQLRAM